METLGLQEQLLATDDRVCGQAREKRDEKRERGYEVGEERAEDT